MFVVVVGIYFQALVRGCQFLQVKMFSFCKYSAVPLPALPPTVQIQISYLGCVELTRWEKRKMLLFSAFCYRLQDLLEIWPLGTGKTVCCQKCYLVYPYSEDFRINLPSS